MNRRVTDQGPVYDRNRSEIRQWKVEKWPRLSSYSQKKGKGRKKKLKTDMWYV